MVTYRITMTSNGRLTLPADIRRRLELKAGDRLTVSIVDGKIVLAQDELNKENAIGSLPSPPGLESDDLMALTQVAVEDKAERLTREF